jgi:hypothetical protein
MEVGSSVELAHASVVAGATESHVGSCITCRDMVGPCVRWTEGERKVDGMVCRAKKTL